MWNPLLADNARSDHGSEKISPYVLNIPLPSSRQIYIITDITNFLDHLTQIVATLRSVIAAIAHPLVQRAPARAPFFLVLHNRVGRAARLLTRLFDLWQQGRLPPPRPSQAGRPRTTPSAPPIRFPRSRAWLVRIGGHRIAGSGSQLQHFLQRPDIPDFLAAAPQAARHLRPLCRMLGVEIPPALAVLRDPPIIRKPRAATPKPAAPPAEPLRRPLPPYVLAAARAWRPRHG